MTIEQRVAVLEEIFSKLQDYYMSGYSGEEIDALLASAGVPIGITKEYDSVSAMNDDFSSTDVTRGQFVLILTTDTSSEDYGKVYLKGSANWVYVFTLTSLTAIKGPQGPAGKTGAKGADGADGKNFMVLGYYETLSALNAAVPSPGTGDTYGVGTEPPYAFYMYDPTISNWRYVGNLQGPAGPTGGEDNFVRYDAAQSLTDEQKAQARANIGADTVQGTVRYDAAQSLTKGQKTQARGNISALNGQFLYVTFVGGQIGWYRITEPFTQYGTSGYLTVSHAWANGGPSELLLGVSTAPDTHGKLQCLRSAGQINSVPYISNARLVKIAATYVLDLYVSGTGLNDWALQICNCEHNPITLTTPTFISADDTLPSGETLAAVMEYQNPPMLLGVEYKTTERYLGKPVYAQLVNLGAAPSPDTSKSINITNAIYISLEGTLDYSSYRQVLPIFAADGSLAFQIKNSGDAIVAQSLHGTTDYSSQNVHVLAKYIKSTD